MKKILIAAVLAAWTGTPYGAYVWGSNQGPSDSMIAAAESRATGCSIGRKDFEDANRVLDKVFTINTTSLPLRAWARAYPGSTGNTNVKALVDEAAFQENRRQTSGHLITTSCFLED